MSMTWCWLSRWPMVRAWRWPLGSSQLPEAPSRPLVNAYHYTEHPMLSHPFVFVLVYSYLCISYRLCIFVFVFVRLPLHNDQSMHLITARIPCYCLSSYLCTQRDASICWKSILTTHNTSRCNSTNTSTQQNAQCIDCINWLEHKTDGSRISSQEAFQGNSKCGQDYNLLEQHWGGRYWPSYDAAMHQLFRFTASLSDIWARFSAKSCLVEARWQNDEGNFQLGSRRW